MDPLPVSPYDNDDASFQIIAVSALEVYPDAVVVPGLMIANTDTKHYASLADRDLITTYYPVFLLDSNHFRIWSTALGKFKSDPQDVPLRAQFSA